MVLSNQEKKQGIRFARLGWGHYLWTHWPWGNMVWWLSIIHIFHTNFKYWYLEHFLRNFPQVKVAVHFWCWVQLDLGNGLVPSGSKPLPKPMLTKFHDANQLDVNRLLSSSKILRHAVQPFHILTNRQLEMSLEKTLKAKESSKKSV